MELYEKKCMPHGTTPHIGDSEIERYISKIDGWEKKGNKIRKNFAFDNFVSAMKFIDKVASISEEDQHHPDIYISYNKVELVLWTHSIDGLSINDFIVASKINRIKLIV